MSIILLAMAVGGLIAVPATDTVDSYFSSDEFCAEAPSYSDCHISEGLTMAMWDHLWGTRDLIAFLSGVRTAEDFEEIPNQPITPEWRWSPMTARIAAPAM